MFSPPVDRADRASHEVRMVMRVYARRGVRVLSQKASDLPHRNAGLRKPSSARMPQGVRGYIIEADAPCKRMKPLSIL